MQGDNKTITERRLDLGIYKGVDGIVASKDINPKLRCLVVIGVAHTVALLGVGAAHMDGWKPYAAILGSLVVQVLGVMFIESRNATRKRANKDSPESGASG